MNDFLEDLGKRWQQAASARGAEIQVPELDSKIAQELLDLARVTAHSQERRFAPLAAYLAGVAVERLRSQRPELTGQQIADYIGAVRAEVEAE